MSNRFYRTGLEPLRTAISMSIIRPKMLKNGLRGIPRHLSWLRLNQQDSDRYRFPESQTEPRKAAPRERERTKNRHIMAIYQESFASGPRIIKYINKPPLALPRGGGHNIFFFEEVSIRNFNEKAAEESPPQDTGLWKCDIERCGTTSPPPSPPPVGCNDDGQFCLFWPREGVALRSIRSRMRKSDPRVSGIRDGR